MQNIFWYIIIAIISLVSTGYTIYLKRDTYRVSTLLVFYLYMAGFTWICEFLVLGLFNAYSYKTGFFIDPWAQNLLGHLILNTTFYPAAAIIVVTSLRRYTWISFFIALFTFIDYLYVYIRVYEHHWWRYYMTAITVLVLLIIAYKWFDRLKQKRYGLTRAITFYFVAMVIIHTPAPILLLMGKQYYKIGFVNNLCGNLYLSSIIIIFFYHVIEALLLVLFTCVLKRWHWSLIPFFISIVTQSIFVKMGILIMEGGWRFAYTLIVYEVFIAIFILIEKNTLKPNTN
ncbi:hypothetical protein [Clostridium lacusfryxellense]|uniref:hypothetical protein n=1 Tax=Clostridium lacusfryxellense TaxID=205328 RepID=UPI001C0AE407|nr:hypothetical protein [Clostridium lacusfryxellense]MBU3112579.1 hypothetical protein [Clostridium lacusfryxellense]